HLLRGAVAVGGVEEGDALVEGGVDDGPAGVGVELEPEVVGAQPDGGDHQSGPAEARRGGGGGGGHPVRLAALQFHTTPVEADGSPTAPTIVPASLTATAVAESRPFTP